MPLSVLSRSFLDRINAPSRRSRSVKIFDGDAGLANPCWFAGAYHATFPVGKHGPKVRRVTDECRAQLAEHCSRFPFEHESQAAFDGWMIGEIQAIGQLVAETSPATFWSMGRSQKIINILLKYCCAAYHSGDPRFAAFHEANTCIEELTSFLHSPVDRYTIKHLTRKPGGDREWGRGERLISWWRDMSHQHYADMQERLRELAAQEAVPVIHYEMKNIW